MYFYFLVLAAPPEGNQINMSKLDNKNYPRMLQRKFGDHPSISSVEKDV
jgi:hypothetical protein